MSWRDAVPLGLVRACLRMLPQLEADESLEAVQRTGVGTGSLSADASQRLVARWSRLAEGGERAVLKATPEGLRSIGIGFRRVPAQAPAHG